MAELTQTVSPLGGGAPTTSSSGGVAARPLINQTFEPGGDRSAVRSEGGPTIEQTVAPGGSKGSLLGESTRKLLANLDKFGSVHGAQDADKTDSPPAASGPDSAGAPSPAPQPAQSPDAATAAPAKPPDAVAPDVHKERADRYEAANRDLVSQLERLKAAPKVKEPSAREKRLDAAERLYWDDPVAAIRQFVAAVHDHDDPKHADIDAEISGLYTDLTARELGVPVDDARQSKRESARTRQLLAREQRERKAEMAAAAQQPDDPEARETAGYTAMVATALTSKNAEGKSIGDSHPLTMKLAERLYGVKPEALVFARLKQGLLTGEFSRSDSNEKLVELASRAAETHLQDLAKLFGGALPATSTAATPTPQSATANQDASQPKAAPSITNASASVAPATPPAKQETKPVDDDFRRKRPGETEDARRRRIAAHHMGPQ